MASLERNLHNRKWFLDRLRAEIVGPDPPARDVAVVVTPNENIRFESWGDFRKPKIQPNSEEILWQDPPLKRYGAGVLFPTAFTEQAAIKADADATPVDGAEEEPSEDIRADEKLEKEAERSAVRVRAAADESEDYDVTLANAWRPSAMGVSFLADFEREPQGIRVILHFARYQRVEARIRRDLDPNNDAQRDLWFRVPGLNEEGALPTLDFGTQDLRHRDGKIEKPIPGFEHDGLRVSVVSRPCHAEKIRTHRVLTVCLVNRVGRTSGRVDEQTFFQCGIRVMGVSGGEWILPYPEAPSSGLTHEEERVIRLLYRDRQTFAIGHGCAASWRGTDSDCLRSSLVSEVWTECLPAFETPSVSPDVRNTDGEFIRVSMWKLAGLQANDDGSSELRQLLDGYCRWIEALEDLETPRCVVPNVPRPSISPDQHETARSLIEKCRGCLRRMEEGLAFLNSESERSRIARTAFRLTNEAMLISQLRRSRTVRTPTWKESDMRYVWDKFYSETDLSRPDPILGYWRPFQIAFQLLSVRGICEAECQDRATVDLIWFPTGGGKTEAYLGLTAFTVFFSRLSGYNQGGADVLMRYTLRLLTTQQFERAGLLFCSMEDVRRRHLGDLPGLGEKRFRLGMWVGGETSPNTRQEALRCLSALQRDPDAENPFVLLRCPWCGAQMGPTGLETTYGRRKTRKRTYDVLGYKEVYVAGTKRKGVLYKCPDPACRFGEQEGLPISVIDEDLYEAPPNLVIGTVDKFALLAWKPDVRALFGIGPDGQHTGLPPTLIIQDELHLISGPLGSMVGIYETVIEEACTLRQRGGAIVRPKIVASTATISRATDQVRALYARQRVDLFPPAGLEAGDSFFAREDRDEAGALKPGRLYAGVMAPGHGSQQTTQARVYAALLQYPAMMPVEKGDESERDPWWTLVCFFNSLRELGGAATLFVADTRDYLRVLLDRHGLDYAFIRQLLNWDELTSRIRSDQIPRRIQQLEVPFQRDTDGHVKASDACLASNIIEVGIDIDRLGLMAIIGQPKTTSQYIQVSSRIGRSVNAPGLVVTVYSAGKPRDRSHYERFRSYHQRLYSQVEPTSVTPFSPPAADRALHAVLTAIVRQLGSTDAASSPRPFPLGLGTALRHRVERLVQERVRLVDYYEEPLVCRRLSKRLREWEAWNPESYGSFGPPPENAPLIYPAGSHAREEWNGHSWPTMGSLRDVDASCEAEITTFYNEPQDAEVKR